MQRIDTTGKAVDLFGPGKHGYRDGDPSTDTPATRLSAAALNSIQEEISHVIEATGASLDADLNNQLATAIASLISAVGRPYDLAFLAGFAPNGSPADLAVQSIGFTVAARPIRITGIVGLLSTAPVGQAVKIDLLRNGITIFGTKPQFIAGAAVLTPGVFSVGDFADFAAGDAIEVAVTQIGGATKGKGLRLAVVGQALG